MLNLDSLARHPWDRQRLKTARTWWASWMWSLYTRSIQVLHCMFLDSCSLRLLLKLLKDEATAVCIDLGVPWSFIFQE
jgi:hypothetical protein